MTANAPQRGCPTLFAPMSSGDGLLVRLRPPGGVLSARAARSVAHAAAQHGNGVIELGNRASLQLRGLRETTAAPLAAAMVAAGLADADPTADRRRAVIAPPLAGDDPGANPDGAAVTRAIERMQVAEPGLAALHGKFGVLVDAGGVLPVGAATADIRVLLPTSRNLPAGSGNVHILLDGSSLAAGCEQSSLAETVRQLCLAFLDLATRCEPPPHRMRGLVARIGAAPLFAAAGLAPTADIALPSAPVAVGWLPYLGARHGAFGVGLPFGATDAATLQALASLAEQFGDGTLRLTPFRAIVFPGVAAPQDLHKRLAALDVILDVFDARARMSVCPGKPACAGASVPTRADAAAIAALGLAGSIHVSGCEKGCAHPAAADLTLVGADGRYGIIRHGRAADPPVRAGLTIDQIVAVLRADRQGIVA